MPDAPRLDHVGLNVADLDAAERWYCAAFGFERSLALRIDAVELDIVMLINGSGQRLELLSRPGSSLGMRASNPAAAVLSEGYGHMAFDVVGVDAVYERLLGLGATPVMPPQPSPEPDVRMAFVADPEGNLVELLDRTAGTAEALGP
jgi:glyoxylase I family protein